MHLLITGTNGFIGCALVRAAHRRGWQVTGVGRQESANPVWDTVDSRPDDYIRADLTKRFQLNTHPDAVIHDAGLASPWAHPDSFLAANVGTTVRMMEWARAHSKLPFHFISSSSVFYRNTDQLGLTENSPIPPDDEQINIYSRSKAKAERLVRRYPGSWTILRPRAVFGPGDPVLLPRIADAAQAGRLPLFTRPGRAPVICDLTPVDVVAEYVIRAVETGATGTFNLTNGTPVELQEFLLGLLRRMGLPTPTRRLPVGVAMSLAKSAEIVSARWRDYREPLITRYGVSMFAWSKTFDVSHTRSVLGEPLLSIEQSIDQLVEWYREKA